MTVTELTLLRFPGREPTPEAVFANPDRRHRLDPDTGEEIAHLSLPEGVVWVTAGDSCVDLARHRMVAAGESLGDHGVDTPVLELWLSQASREPLSGLRIAVMERLGRTPADIERMLARYLADETIVGVQMRENDPSARVRRLALKYEAVELLREHGHVHARTADVPVSPMQLNSRFDRFTMFNSTLEAWDRELKRFFGNVGALMRRPVPTITGVIGLLAALVGVLSHLGLL